ncbi:KIR protein [Plasmodium coatneyi]|uniref:KIR protein n=1 Tax=Plasmodium coatneyi TaxID=208452 RepID=A0A1B1E6X7_9APIC|nr:KIR protein [Plasmodium coatneyi]ANQ10751.1 KIR protein [Plasmodium coatneyi]
MAPGVTARIYAELKNAHTSHPVISEDEGPDLGSLGGLLEGGDSAAKSAIAAWYLASKKKNEGGDEKYCHFFYYWVGQMLNSSNRDESFSLYVNLIYNQLEGVNVNGVKCPNITTTDNVTWSLFQKRKTVFDYYHDYDTIQQQLLQQDGDGNWCESTHVDYLKAISLVYNDVLTSCANDNNDPCCVKYNREVKSAAGDGNDDKYELLLKQSCAAAATEKESEQFTTLQGTDSTTATIPIVSSVLGIMSLPTIVFFLYKYTNLFSGLHGTLSPTSRRKKREGSFRHELNTLTEHDSLTEYSTDYSTEMNSIRTYSMTEYSAPPPSSRRRNNSNGQQPQRTNISYHPR